MEQYILFKEDNKITIQEAEYIEDGCYIEIVGRVITVWSIPFGGGGEQKIANCKTLIEAFEVIKTIT